MIFDHMKKAMILFLFMSVSFGMLAQDQLLKVAKQYLLSGDYIKAAATFKQLVDYNQEDATVLLGYFESLKGLKDYKTAEKIIKQQLKLNDKNVSYQFELAKLYKLQGEDKKASKIVESIIHQLKPEDDAIRNTAMMFQKEGMFNEAISVFEKGKSFAPENPYLYAEELALLYDKKGDTEKATDQLLDLYISKNEKSEEIKATFQRMFNNPEKLESFRKKVQKRATKEPDIVAYPDLLAWLYIQQNDYENAFIQISPYCLRLCDEQRQRPALLCDCLQRKTHLPERAT